MAWMEILGYSRENCCDWSSLTQLRELRWKQREGITAAADTNLLIRYMTENRVKPLDNGN